MNWIMFAAAALGGAALSFAGFCISKRILKKDIQKYPAASIIRQIINIAWLVTMFFVGQKTPIDGRYLLIGGALGLVIPSYFFTVKLAKTAKKESEDN